MNNTANFKRGDRVTYIPTHAEGDINHKDCETGVVSSINDKVVFVKYGYTDPDVPFTAAATMPEDLVNHSQRKPSP